MMGMFWWDRDGRPWFFELVTIEPGAEDTLLLRIKHFHPGLVGWEEREESVRFVLVALGDREMVLLQQDRPNPPWMVYRRRDDALESYFQRAGEMVADADVFRYRLR
jgi:hypothetical protein